MMSKVSTSAVVLAVLAASACHTRVAGSTPAADGPRAADYYPLQVGNRWTYDAQFLGEKRQQTVELTREENGFFADSQGGQLSSDAFGVRDQKRYLLRDPLEPGRKWTNVVSVSSVEHYTILSVGRPCEAPAGTYQDCVEVEGRNRVDDKTTLVNRLTFAPKVGIVTVRVLAESGGREIPQTQLSLRSFQTGGKR